MELTKIGVTVKEVAKAVRASHYYKEGSEADRARYENDITALERISENQVLIPEDDWTLYAEQQVLKHLKLEGISALSEWPLNELDWSAVEDKLKEDYSSIEVADEWYWWQEV